MFLFVPILIELFDLLAPKLVFPAPKLDAPKTVLLPKPEELKAPPTPPEGALPN